MIYFIGLAEIFPKNNYKTNKYCGKTKYKSGEVISECKVFDAKKNDIWCVGVCLFMMIFGISPWTIADKKSDQCYNLIMNGHLRALLKKWGMLKYANSDILDLLQSIFQNESKRCTLSQIKHHSWIKVVNNNQMRRIQRQIVSDDSLGSL